MPDSPYLYENTIRKLDEAVFNWLGAFKVDYGTLAGTERNGFPLLRVFASPHRAYAETANMLVAQGWIAGDSPEVQRINATYDWTVLPLPVVSIERDDPIISNELSASATHVPRARYNYETKEWETDPYPLHYLTQYRLTFWCEKQYTRAAFMEWILSQIGRAGAAQSEMYLPIEHPVPYGKQLHQWRYLGSGNMSDLEGSDARHLRSMLSFTLRSWAFRKPDFSAPAVHTTAVESHANDDQETFPESVGWGTNNLFILGKSPRCGETVGAATAVKDDAALFAASLKTSDDRVILTSPEAVPGTAGRSVWSVVVDAEGSAAWAAEVTQLDDDGAETPVASVPMPGVRMISHNFCVATEGEVRVSIAPAGILPATVRLFAADVRQVRDGARIVPTSYARVGAVIRYQWDYLERRPYLVIAARESGDGIVSVYDDVAAPEHTRSALIDDLPGFALLTMPKASTVALDIPDDVKLLAVYVQVFDGPFAGNRV